LEQSAANAGRRLNTLRASGCELRGKRFARSSRLEAWRHGIRPL